MSMFSRHCSKRLSAFCNGETGAEESKRIADHLTTCQRCRNEYDEIRLGVQLAAQLSLVTAPDEIWNGIQRLLTKDRNLAAARTARSGFRKYRLATAVAAVLVIAALAGLAWLQLVHQGPIKTVEDYGPGPKIDKPADLASWQVQTTGGAAVRIGSENITDSGRIVVGEALETGNNSTARINVGEIGHVDVEPNTRIRLVDARETEHRLALDRGTLHARIIAPPRLFFVDTPSAEAVDLGCAYTLQVDDQGRTFLHVTAGWVSLVRQGIESFVPYGAMCQTRPGIGPGTPYFEDASPQFIAALDRFDFQDGGDPSFAVVLSQARDRDTLTLWHLLRRVPEDERSAVINRITALVRLPRGVTRQGLMKLDPAMLDFQRWQDLW
jgi:hypothetical protein